MPGGNSEKVGEIRVDFVSDTSKVRRDLAATRQELGKTEGSVRGLGRTLQGIRQAFSRLVLPAALLAGVTRLVERLEEARRGAQAFRAELEAASAPARGRRDDAVSDIRGRQKQLTELGQAQQKINQQAQADEAAINAKLEARLVHLAKLSGVLEGMLSLQSRATLEEQARVDHARELGRILDARAAQLADAADAAAKKEEAEFEKEVEERLKAQNEEREKARKLVEERREEEQKAAEAERKHLDETAREFKEFVAESVAEFRKAMGDAITGAAADIRAASRSRHDQMEISLGRLVQLTQQANNGRRR